MRTLANIIWHFPVLGFISAGLNFVLGGLLTITGVGAPIGLGLIQYSKFLLTPFSSTMVSGEELQKNENKIWQAFSYLIWFIYLPVGLVLASVSIIQIICLFVSIIGIPTAIVLAKSLNTYVKPINKKCVPIEVGTELKRIKAQEQIQNKL